MNSIATANYISGYIDIGSMIDPLDNYIGTGQTETYFETTIRKIAPFTHLPSQMKVSGGQADRPQYTVFKSADVLLYSPELIQLPEIRVVSGSQATYRVFWSRNPAHNIVQQGQITFTEVPISSFDTVIQDQLSQHGVEAGRWKVYNKMIGNLTSLLTPSNYLPPTTLVNMGQWTYDRPGHGLMLCCATGNTIQLAMTHMTDLTKLLRVQRYTAGVNNAPGTWANVPTSSVDLQAILNVTGGWGKMTLQMPEMWGEYAVLSDDERNYHVKRVIDQLVLIYPKHTSGIASAGLFDITFSFHHPLRALFYNAVNVTALQYNNYSNYTTDPNDDDGINPIRTTSYYYDSQPRFENLPNAFTSDIYPYKHATRCPQDVGYNAIFYCMRLGSVQMDGWTEPNRIETNVKLQVVEASTNATDPTFAACQYRIELRGQCVNIVRYQREAMGFPNLNALSS